MKSIAIFPNIKKDKDLSLTKKIAKILLSSSMKVKMATEFGVILDSVELLPYDEIFDSVDCAVTVGGDGTLLRIAERASEKGISVIGVNLGKMGFMAELEPNEIDLLHRISTGDFFVEKRKMLDVSIIRDGKTISTCRALNDIVVSNGSVSKIAELELYCNSTLVSPFHADGLIISTPTGSTAYSLSAGGSIIDPTVDCMLFTPVSPHSFYNSRPIVFSSKSVLAIKDVQSEEENTYLTIDGKINFKLLFSDIVEVRLSDKTTNLIKIKDEKFYDRVYQKIAERN